MQAEAIAVSRHSGPGPARVLRAVFSFRVMLALGLAVVCCLTVRGRFNDPDLWFHLRLGKTVWETHSIPAADLFSYTVNGHFWTAHEWLAELGMYAVYRLGGYTGLMLGFSLLTSLLLILVYFRCYLGSGNTMASFLGGLSAWFFATVGFAIRPVLLGYTLLALELIFLDLAARNRRWLWALPPLFAIWVNCHGSYLFGMGVLCVYWICSFVRGKWGLLAAEPWEKGSSRMLGLVLVLSAAALLLNPVGIRLLLYPLNVAFKQTTSLNSIAEWFPTDPASARGMGAIAVVFGILLVSMVRRSELHLRELLLVGMGFALAMQHVRMLFVFGIVVSPVLSRVVAPLLGEDRERDHPMANAMMMAAFVVAIIAGFPTPAGLREQIRQHSPAGAVDFIRRTHLRGPMLNEYVFGDYLTWALPEEKVFIDGRGDVFDWAGVLAAYGRWTTLAEDPNILLDRYKVRFCLLSKNSAMVRVLPYVPGWRRVYSGNVAVIFVRDGSR